MAEKVGSREKVAIVTLGCEKNLVDSDMMAHLIDEKGYELVENPEEATVVIVNTCGFIDAAKEESVNKILDMAELKETGKLKSLVVAGCLTQRYKEDILNEIPEVDGIVGTGDFMSITGIIEESLEGKRPIFVGNPIFTYEDVVKRKVKEGTYSAYIKIAEGCDNACTFCSIPLMRGGFRSRTIESILEEARHLAAQGIVEVSLIAQDSTNYGTDIYDGKLMLPELLNRLSEVDGIQWIRLHYAYPGFFTDELIHTFATNPKVCKYVDMPLQHSEDHILKRMRRPGRQTDIRALVAKIRAQVPDVALRTSLIVGFPGETEEDFARLSEFVKDIRFDRLGVFTYSNEDDTPASRLPDHVEEETKEKRANLLMEIQREVAGDRNSRFVGQVLEVLIERYEGRNDIYVGRTQYDAPEIDGEVFVSGFKGELGSIAKVKITHSFEYDLAGEVV
ncbi:30S ribosomal protein S12 methylthiotransferase RimO [Brevibacillus choshinensis]|uniref:30S ribosomal protein S12 methylthiotransferase RimO n=1 Tax=Brevibacillus choshinensis TaxID=54911 RepID=UPI002E250823|nr:30S ribosomal protein S12 methylthiotransferase RimO [Brevibacillus choshinensis]MED4582132.1 30S ribosomal protein S12 methylthiotransferase RimO [Brevibacillus choshinensis]MED4750200.1 30S ribosomal protein S12 methylthiotransferase RimO [Brevibacillus choshinensis]MED4780786.1 30S ribosomal protein S12 methylthiotransferase RimO [Brevibacillus choshinensis]